MYVAVRVLYWRMGLYFATIYCAFILITQCEGPGISLGAARFSEGGDGGGNARATWSLVDAAGFFRLGGTLAPRWHFGPPLALNPH